MSDLGPSHASNPQASPANAALRRCGPCGGIMVVDDESRLGSVVMGTSFACEGCASTALVLTPIGYGFLYGSAVVCLIAAVVFGLGKEVSEWIAAACAVGLGAFFVFLAQLRRRDAQKNPPIA